MDNGTLIHALSQFFVFGPPPNMPPLHTGDIVSSAPRELRPHHHHHLTTIILKTAGPHFRLTLILYHPRSRFAAAIEADVAARRVIDYGAITLADHHPADANANTNNPFLDPTTTPETGGNMNQAERSSSSGANRASAALAQCGQRRYCSRASDCSIGGCRCVADGGDINLWSASCRAVLTDARRLLEKNNSTNNNNKRASASPPNNSSAGVVEVGSKPVVGGDLPCPCNCTYVSKQCCSSSSTSSSDETTTTTTTTTGGIVYEPPANHLGALRPPMGYLECDRTTGEWRNRRRSSTSNIILGGHS